MLLFLRGGGGGGTGPTETPLYIPLYGPPGNLLQNTKCSMWPAEIYCNALIPSRRAQEPWVNMAKWWWPSVKLDRITFRKVAPKDHGKDRWKTSQGKTYPSRSKVWVVAPLIVPFIPDCLHLPSSPCLFASSPLAILATGLLWRWNAVVTACSSFFFVTLPSNNTALCNENIAA